MFEPLRKELIEYLEGQLRKIWPQLDKDKKKEFCLSCFWDETEECKECEEAYEHCEKHCEIYNLGILLNKVKQDKPKKAKETPANIPLPTQIISEHAAVIENYMKEQDIKFLTVYLVAHEV